MIEEKLCRLSPEQRKEVEDFIDFLMNRDTGAPRVSYSRGMDSGFVEIQEPAPSVSHSIFSEDHATSPDTGRDILPDYPEYGGESISPHTHPHHEERPAPRPRRMEKDPGQLLDWVD